MEVSINGGSYAKSSLRATLKWNVEINTTNYYDCIMWKLYLYRGECESYKFSLRVKWKEVMSFTILTANHAIAINEQQLL